MGPSSRPSGAASWLSTLLVPPILALFTVAPLAHQPATTAHEHSRLAPPATESDFNGDGFSDLAVGVPNEDLGPIADAGAVNVLFGTPSGLQASAPEDQLITQALGPGEGPEAGDRFGAGLATADFNGDGYSDLA